MNVTRYWRANNHQWGSGKTHFFDDEREGRTVCGLYIDKAPGREVPASLVKVIDCVGCLKLTEHRERREAERAEALARQRAFDEEQARKDREWHAKYDAHLLSDQWVKLRRKVIRRAHGICEGCGERAATQIHHLTYDMLGDEMLFQLVGLCKRCHSKIHGREI
jgi:5-methylcytosine-specific restriction endonuclease McrA